MRVTVIRALLFAILYLLLRFVVHAEADVLWAFALTFIFEPAITEALAK